MWPQWPSSLAGAAIDAPADVLSTVPYRSAGGADHGATSDQSLRTIDSLKKSLKISRASTDWLLLAGFCGFLFFFGLAHFGLIGADEPRYAQVAREMLARHDWITPTLAGKPWLEKPPLYYWQAMLAYSIFGVSDWAARLPSAVDATLMVVAIYLFLSVSGPAFNSMAR